MNKKKFTVEQALKETDKIFENTFKEFCINSGKYNFFISDELIKNVAGYFFHSGCEVGMEIAGKKVNELLNKNE